MRPVSTCPPCRPGGRAPRATLPGPGSSSSLGEEQALDRELSSQVGLSRLPSEGPGRVPSLVASRVDTESMAAASCPSTL